MNLFGRGLLMWMRSKLMEKVLQALYARMFENLVVLGELNHVTVLDSEGSLVEGKRAKHYAVRWRPVDFFPPERISIGPTGTITDFKVTAPKTAELKFLEGGLQYNHCTFQIRAPNMSPTYLFLNRSSALEVMYKGMNIYTQDTPPEPMTWCKRVPFGKPRPHKLIFQLALPKEKPMLREPRIFRIDQLSATESAHTDIGLDKAPGWLRMPDQSKESTLECDINLDFAKWTIRPPRQDIAYKFEWDWWK